MQAHGMLRWPVSARTRLVTIKSKLKQFKMKRLLNRYGKRAALITKEARTNAGTDRAITVKDIELSKALLAWRKGAWGAGRFQICVCGRHYLFNHFVKCERVTPPVRAMHLEYKMAQVVQHESRIKMLFTEWEAQLARVNDDTGYLTADDASFETADEAEED